jgi:hypothetical protein
MSDLPPEPRDSPPQSTAPEGSEPEVPGPAGTLRKDRESPPGTNAGTSSGERGEQGNGKRNSVVTQVVASTSFLGALLIYMGWNYDNSLLQQFSIPSPASVGLSTVDFALAGVSPLFRSDAVLFGAVLVGVILVAARYLPEKDRTKIASLAKSPGPLFLAGLALTVIMLAVTWPQVSGGGFGGWLGSHVDGVYLALALLAAGQLLMAWPTRLTPAGHIAYPLALVVVSVLGLWAGGVYAGTLGFQVAVSIEENLNGQMAVTVYSAQPLDLSGPGVTCARALAGPGFSYECSGLRLLWSEPDAYYLLPAGWKYGNDDHTYILDDSDQIRVELYLSPGS